MSRPTSSRSSPAAAASAPPSTADLHFPEPPNGTVSAVIFSPIPSHSTSGMTSVLVSSWDHCVHHYTISSSSSSDCDGAVNKVQTFPHEAPVLDVCFIADDLAASASVDRRVRLLNLTTGKCLILGKHEDSVLKVRWCPQTRLLVSGSADRSLKFWNVDEGKVGFLKTLPMPDKVIAMDISPPFFFGTNNTDLIFSASSPGKPHPRDPIPRLVVAMTGRHVFVFDLFPLRSAINREQKGEKVAERDFDPDQKRESSLKYMTRDVRCMPAGDGYVTSSIEGRVSVEFFDPSEKAQKGKYAFKCHRQTIDGNMEVEGEGEEEEEEERPYDVVFPVHGIAFHPRHGTFASLGGDAVISVWDAAAKKRIRQYPKFGAAVTAGTFDAEGKLLLVAMGDDSVTARKKDGKGEVTLVLKRNAWDECKPKIKPSSSSKPSSSTSRK